MKKNLLQFSMIAAASLSLAMASDAASITTSISSTGPSPERSLVRAIAPADNTGAAYMLRYYNNYTTGAKRQRQIGQSFVIPGTEPLKIDGIVLRIDDSRTLSTVALDFTLSIYKADSSGIPDGSAIYVSTGDFPTGLTDQYYITFLLNDNVVLEDGGRYCFQLAYSTSSGASQLSFAASGTSVYNEGRSFYYENSNTNDLAEMVYTSSQRDLDFAILYTPTPIPETKTAGLMLLSLGGWALYRSMGARRTRRAD